MPFNTHVTPGVLDNTHKAFRDIDSFRRASGSSGSIDAATFCVASTTFLSGLMPKPTEQGQEGWHISISPRLPLLG